MKYLEELRVNWRPLVAAAAGLGAGLSLNAYMGSLFAPHVIEEFGWEKSDYALIGLTGLLIFAALPVYGRMADILGVRRVAAIGVVGYPLGFVAFSLVTGDIRVFLAIAALQTLFGASTTSAVYSRIVAQHFTRARGFALALAISGPALIGALASPLVTAFIEAEGWRAGYRAAAGFTFLLGLTALFLIPPRRTATGQPADQEKRRAGKDYGLIARSFAFWIIIAGTVLCNLSHVITASQLNLVLLDTNATLKTAAMLISTYAIGVIVGRLVSGLALDRFPSHIIAAIGHALPGIGMLLIASPWDSPIVLGIAMILIGVLLGAEGDIAAYLVMRIFGIRIYGTVFSLVAASLGLASAAGSIFLRTTLQVSDGYALFLLINSVLIFIGAALFMLLGPHIRRAPLTGQTEAASPER